MKTLIHQFDPTIYPRKLWVMKGGFIDNIADSFTEPDSRDIYLPIEKGKEPNAMVFKVRHKETGYYGVFCWLCGAKIEVADVAHEAVHVAACIFDDCNIYVGFDEGKDEAFAYLTGFAADCINQVRINKFRE